MSKKEPHTDFNVLSLLEDICSLVGGIKNYDEGYKFFLNFGSEPIYIHEHITKFLTDNNLNLWIHDKDEGEDSYIEIEPANEEDVNLVYDMRHPDID